MTNQRSHAERKRRAGPVTVGTGSPIGVMLPLPNEGWASLVGFTEYSMAPPVGAPIDHVVHLSETGEWTAHIAYLGVDPGVQIYYSKVTRTGNLVSKVVRLTAPAEAKTNTSIAATNNPPRPFLIKPPFLCINPQATWLSC